MDSKVKVGLIGCGKICDAYFLGSKRYEIIEIVACADLDPARARAKAGEHAIPKACTVDELLADPAIEMVLNLTIPAAHAEINERALRAGKHVYAEKPFALNSADAQRVLALAKAKNLLVGCAPDTFLGGGLQTCRKLVDDGAIGKPVAALAFCMGHGPEHWHPSPDFFYKRGGGPMFDMGPYYITALINLFGPVARVSGSAGMSLTERVITNPDPALFGKIIGVETPTHVTGVMDFVNGASATIVMSFDVWSYPLPCLVVHGTESTMEVPDPNTFVGPVRLRTATGKTYNEVPLTHSEDRGRGTGLADMAYAIRAKRPHRASGELAGHVVEVMEGFERSSNSGRYAIMSSSCQRPAMLPVGLPANALDS